MKYTEVEKNWSSFSKAIKEMGGDVQAFIVEKPATDDEIAKLQNELGFQIPLSLKKVLTEFSRKVEFRWFFPKNYELKDGLSGIFSGDRHWSLDWIVQFNEDKNGWRDEVFPDKENDYDVVWHNKLAFHEVGNGDYLAIDLSIPHKEPVVYLSHDDGEGHGVEIAKNFEEFVYSTSRIGCVGGEDWQWLPFINEGEQFINPNCENANILRESLGVIL